MGANAAGEFTPPGRCNSRQIANSGKSQRKKFRYQAFPLTIPSISINFTFQGSTAMQLNYKPSLKGRSPVRLGKRYVIVFGAAWGILEAILELLKLLFLGVLIRR
jgi:hypothetical protein